MDLNFLSEEHRLYFEEARLGEKARQFFASDLGRYVLGRAQGEMEEAKAEMLKINAFSPFAKRKLARCQQKHVAAERAILWMAQAIDNGEAAYQSLQDLESAS